MDAFVAQQVRRAEHRLDDELSRHLAREPEQDPGLDHRLGEQREVRGARARDRGDRVHVALRHLDHRAEVAERFLGQAQMLVARVRACTDARDAFVDGCRPVRHRAHDGNAVGDLALDRGGRDRGRD